MVPSGKSNTNTMAREAMQKLDEIAPATDAGEIAPVCTRSFSNNLGSLSHKNGAEVMGPRVNILVLDQEDSLDEIQTEEGQNFDTEAAYALPCRAAPFRQGSFQRRGQSCPAASFSQNLLNIDTWNHAAPEFRDVLTPDAHQSGPRLQMGAASGFSPNGLQSRSNAKGKWGWIASGLDGKELSEHKNMSHPLHNTIKQRQSVLQGTTQVDPCIKQALYNHWGQGSLKKEHRGAEMIVSVMDVEVFVAKKMQKLIASAKRLFVNQSAGDGDKHGHLPVKAGWPVCTRKNVWGGSKTVRQHVQLCIDGSFLMRKTEQINSPIIFNKHVRDMDIQEDINCNCTINLVPHIAQHLTVSSPAASPRRRFGTGLMLGRAWMVSFKVSDPVLKQQWISAFEMRKDMTKDQEGVKVDVTTLANRLKLGNLNGKKLNLEKSRSNLIQNFAALDQSEGIAEGSNRATAEEKRGIDGSLPGILTSTSPQGLASLDVVSESLENGTAFDQSIYEDVLSARQVLEQCK